MAGGVSSLKWGIRITQNHRENGRNFGTGNKYLSHMDSKLEKGMGRTDVGSSGR